jgi:hypothetical protein
MFHILLRKKKKKLLTSVGPWACVQSLSEMDKVRCGSSTIYVQAHPIFLSHVCRQIKTGSMKMFVVLH